MGSPCLHPFLILILKKFQKITFLPNGEKSSLPQKFNDFFIQKINKIQDGLQAEQAGADPHEFDISAISRLEILLGCPNKQCKLDLCHTTLKKLHWLPIQQRIEFEITYKFLHGQGPAYLSDLLTAKSALRSTDSFLLRVPRTQLKTTVIKYFKRQPELWNDMPLISVLIHQ